MKKIIIILISLVIVTENFGETKQTPEQQSSEVVLETIWEKQFDEPVVDVIFGEEEITVKEAKSLRIKNLEKIKKMKDEEKVKVNYPKVIMISDKDLADSSKIKLIKFLDKNEKIKREFIISENFLWKPKKGVYFHTSKNKKYIAVTSSIPEYYVPQNKVKGTERETVILDTDGNILRRIRHWHSVVFVSPSGQYVVGAGYDEGIGPICIYNENGLIGKIEKDGRDWHMDFSKNGDFFAVTFTKRIKDPEFIFRADLAVFDNKGNELWRKADISRKGSACCEVVISDNNVITVITGVDEYKIYQFNKKGELLKIKQGNLNQLRVIDEKKQRNEVIDIDEIIK